MLVWSISVASAGVPVEVPHQGRLMDATGVPLSGSHTLDARIYDDAGLLLWSDTFAVAFDNGYYAVRLGSQVAFPEDLWDGTALSLGLSVDSGPELGTLPIDSVPFARIAENVVGGVADVGALYVDGTLIVGPDGKYRGTVDVGETLGGLSCVAGELALFDGGKWGCAALADVAETGSYADLVGAPDLADVAISGSYGDLTGTPQLADVAFSGSYDDLSGAPALADVATSGAYADLAGVPALSAVATSGSYGDLTGTPAFADVAFSGSYDDLAGTPVLADVALSGVYEDLSGTPVLADVALSGAYEDLSGTPVLADVALSGAYEDLSGTPILATVATTGAYGDLSGKPTLATVATTGAYDDLSGIPTFATVATTGAYDDLSGTPTLATVATTGAYDDLSGTPTLHDIALTGDYADLDGAPTLAAIATSGDAADLTGTVPFSALPVGTSSTTVARGDHSHGCAPGYVRFSGGSYGTCIMLNPVSEAGCFNDECIHLGARPCTCAETKIALWNGIINPTTNTVNTAGEYCMSDVGHCQGNGTSCATGTTIEVSKIWPQYDPTARPSQWYQIASEGSVSVCDQARPSIHSGYPYGAYRCCY